MANTYHALDCGCGENSSIDRRQFVQGVAATAGVAATVGLPTFSLGKEEAKPKSETLVKKLYDSLSPAQRDAVCFAWDFTDKRGLLRTHVSNNWSITDVKNYNVAGEFFTKDQQDLIEAIFFGMYNPEWHDRIRKQLKDDAGGYGRRQTIAIFGEPGSGKFEFVMTGRHLTIRCDGDSEEHVAFGGPIFYGHAAQGFNEKADHPGNVFWHQALKANDLYKMMDGKQRNLALIDFEPDESGVPLQGEEGKFPGIPTAELSSDQKEHLEGVLDSLLEPYRLTDQEEARKCLKAQGGLEACSLSFYEASDIGNDKVWDTWRLEGPSFVWHFRGNPHVHVWVNVAENSSPKLNARG